MSEPIGSGPSSLRERSRREAPGSKRHSFVPSPCPVTSRLAVQRGAARFFGAHATRPRTRRGLGLVTASELRHAGDRRRGERGSNEPFGRGRRSDRSCRSRQAARGHARPGAMSSGDVSRSSSSRASGEVRRSVESRPVGGKAAGNGDGPLRGGTCRWKALRIVEPARVDASAEEAVLAVGGLFVARATRSAPAGR